MKLALLVSLVSFLLLVDVQAIRLEPGLKTLDHQRFHEEKGRLIEVEVSSAAEEKDGQSSGRSRKLITNIPATSATTKTVKSEGAKVNSIPKHQHEENFSVRTSPEHGESTTEQYPDIIDIAGMDYSPAKRKPPIHN